MINAAIKSQESDLVVGSRRLPSIILQQTLMQSHDTSSEMRETSRNDRTHRLYLLSALNPPYKHRDLAKVPLLLPIY